MYAIAESDGKAGVVVFTDSAYAIALSKARRDGGGGQEVRRLHGAVLRGLASRRRVGPHAAAHHLAGSALRRQVDPQSRHQRPLLRLHGRLPHLGRQGPGGCALQHLRRRRQRVGLSSASAPASSRPPPCPSPWHCRAGSWSTSSTAPSPAREPSGYFAPVHLVTKANVEFDGGAEEHLRPRQRLSRRLPRLLGQVADRSPYRRRRGTEPRRHRLCLRADSRVGHAPA